MRDWETVTTVGTDEEAALVAGFLAAAGIPAEIESLLFHQEPVNFGQLGQVRVKVPAERLEAARAALASPSPAGDGELLEEE